MSGNFLYVLNINSFSISLTGIDVFNKNFSRCYYKRIPYDGIKNNFFKNPEALYAKLETLVNSCRDTLNRQINGICLILPQRFFRTKHMSAVIDIKKGKTVNKFDIAALKEKSFALIDDCATLCSVPIAYRVAEDYIDNPIGLEGTQLELLSSTIGVFYRVKEFFNDAGKRIDVKFDIMSAAMPILEKLQADLNTNRSPRILLNVNEGSIDVCYCEMCAVISEKTIDWGEIHFVEALSNLFNIEREEAALLLKHINFNIKGDGEYVINTTEVKTFDVQNANKRIKELLIYICNEVKTAVSAMIGDCVLPIYVTGSNICNLRGIGNIVEEQFNTAVSVLQPDVLQWNTPKDYIIVGTIEHYLKN